MPDITDWLARIGLERYCEAFAANGIGLDVVGDLTDADLRELGLSLGDRKRVLKAAAAISEQHPQLAEPPQPPAPVQSEAERRQLTVMFCDLVGSTALSGRLDPEDLRAIIGAYQARATEVIEAHGGFVAKYMGDGVLAYFGYPQAHEEDAERAVRAGLELTKAIEGLRPAGEAIEARIGIATGLVVVGDLVGSGEAQERGVVGETPNLAARLQELSRPGAVAIASSTRRLVGNLFDCKNLGSADLKGFREPIEIWQVLSESGIDNRFEALRSGHSPLVGREEELQLLLRRWQLAKQGEGRVVLISGEPGIGKSRIAAAVEEHIHDEAHVPLRYFCSPHHQSTALYPVVAQLERAAGFRHDDSLDARLDKLEILLARSSATLEEISLIADLLSLTAAARYPPLNLTPQRRRERMFETLLHQLEKLAGQEPVLMVFEDTHWLDPTTREFLDLAVDRAENLPVLLIMTYRPEFQPPWAGRPHVTVLALNRLDHRHAAEIAGRVAGKVLPQDILGQILVRTDGVPLFLEELTKTMIESGLLDERSDRFVLRGPVPSLAVPATLRDALMARLDRLSAVKEIAQIGSVIGREFSYKVLRAVAAQPEERLRQGLDQLIAGELVFQRGIPPEALYIFKHALVQDATYSSLLREKRQYLHARIARALQEQFGDTTKPETIAHHCTEAGLITEAIQHWRAAGDLAANQYANREAINHYRKGLELLSRVAEADWRDEQELRLSIALGPVLMTVMTTGSAEIERTYARARELARARGRTGELFTAVWNYCLLSYIGGQRDIARQLAEELAGLARDLGDAGYRLQAHHAAFMVALGETDLPGAADSTAKALAIYDRHAHRDHALVYGGHDPGVCAHCMGGIALLLSGFPDQAVAWIEAGLALARDLAHPPTIGHALRFASDLCFMLDRPEDGLRHAEALLPLPRDQLSGVGVSNARMLRGWALRLVRAALGFAAADDLVTATELLDEASVHQEQNGEAWIEPELHRLRGHFGLRLRHSRAEAQRCFQQALSVARRHGVRWFELRAARCLAELWLEEKRLAEARDLLTPITEALSEGKEAPDVKAAMRLLERAAEASQA